MSSFGFVRNRGKHTVQFVLVHAIRPDFLSLTTLSDWRFPLPLFKAQSHRARYEIVLFGCARIWLVLYITKGTLTVGGFQGHLKLDQSNVDSGMLWLAMCGLNVDTRVDIMQVVSCYSKN